MQENIDTFISRGGVHLVAALLNDPHPSSSHQLSPAAASATADAAAVTKESARALGNIAAADAGRQWLLHAPEHLHLTSHLNAWFKMPVDDHRHLLALRMQWLYRPQSLNCLRVLFFRFYVRMSLLVFITDSQYCSSLPTRLIVPSQ